MKSFQLQIQTKMEKNKSLKQPPTPTPSCINAPEKTIMHLVHGPAATYFISGH